MSECKFKKPYKTWAIAEKAAASASRKDGNLITPYKCPRCHKIHIGHQDLIIKQKTQHKKRLEELKLQDVDIEYVDAEDRTDGPLNA